MAQFKNSVITEKGLALLQKVQQRTLKLTYTQITTGAGEYTGTEELSGATALKDQRQSVQISSISAVDSTTVKLVAVISNTGLEQGYRITEVGIWAKDPDEGDILFSLAVAEPNGADYIPAETGGSISMNFEMYQTVTASTEVNIQPGTGAYASAKDLQDFIDCVMTTAELDAMYDATDYNPNVPLETRFLAGTEPQMLFEGNADSDVTELKKIYLEAETNWPVVNGMIIRAAKWDNSLLNTESVIGVLRDINGENKLVKYKTIGLEMDTSTDKVKLILSLSLTPESSEATSLTGSGLLDDVTVCFTAYGNADNSVYEYNGNEYYSAAGMCMIPYPFGFSKSDIEIKSVVDDKNCNDYSAVVPDTDTGDEYFLVYPGSSSTYRKGQIIPLTIQLSHKNK